MAHVKEPYGLKGWVKLYTHGTDAGGLRGFSPWWLNRSPGRPDWQATEPEAMADHSGVLVAKFVGIEDREAAFALKGAEIAVSRSQFAASGDNEYYWADLLGLSVLNLQGDVLGEVVDLMDLGPHQVLRVRHVGGERLIPFVAQYVDGVDLDLRVVRVDWGLDY
jgi:16S rRNA processing protein RimM